MGYLSPESLDLDRLVRAVSAPSHGGVATFTGTVRDHHDGRAVVALEYSAYGPMVEEVCGAVIREAEQRWPVTVALAHRVGILAIGEPSVVVAAGSAHRDAAFAACRWVIEAVKTQVPIWKRERYADGGEAWVDPTAGRSPAPADQRP